MNKTTRIGILGGFMAIFLITIFYLTRPQMLVEGYVWLKQLVFLGAIIYGLSQMRQNSVQAPNIKALAASQKEATPTDHSKDFVGFTELLANGVKIYLIGYFLTFLYIYLLFNYIDTDLVELVKDHTVRLNIQLKDPKISALRFEEQLAELRKQDFSPRLTDLISVMGMVEIILGFLMSFIVALFLRREQPTT